MIFSLAPFSLALSGAVASLTGSDPAATQASLVSALPARTVAAIHFPNPKAMMAAKETNHWVAFATDPQLERHTLELLGLMLAEDELLTDDEGKPISTEQLAEWWHLALETIEDSTGAVAFVFMADAPKPEPGVLSIGGGDADTEPSPDFGAGLIVRGGEKTAALMRRFVGEDAQTDTLAGGQEVLIHETDTTELYFDQGGLVMAFSAASLAGVKGAAESCLSALGRTESSGPFAHPEVAPLRSTGAAFEFAVDGDTLWDVAQRTSGDTWNPAQAKLMDSFFSVDWMYGSFDLGVGEASDWNVYVPYGQDNWLGGALSFFGEANMDLLSSAPQSTISATVGAFDLGGFAKWALDVLEGESEEFHAQALAGLQMANSATGVDILSDVIGNMTGQFLGFSTAVSAEDAESALSFSNFGETTLVALMGETESTLDLVEALVSMSGMEQIITSEVIEIPGAGSEIELYKTDASRGLPVAVGVGSGRLLISSDIKTLDSYIELVKTPALDQSFMGNKSLRAALAEASGAIISVQPTAAVADAIEGFGEMMSAMTEENWETMAELESEDEDDSEDEEWDEEWDEEAEAAFDAAFDASMKASLEQMASSFNSIGSLWRQYFSGTTATEVEIGDGLIHLRTLTR